MSGNTREELALGIRRCGPEALVLIRPSASLPEAFAGSPGTRKRRIVTEEAQLQGAEGMEEKGSAGARSRESLTTTEHDRGAAPPTRAICRVVTLLPRSIDRLGERVPPQLKTS